MYVHIILTPQTFMDAQLRASCRAVSPPCTATAPPTTTRLSRGWCWRHSAPGENYLPSRTTTASDVTGRPKRSSRQQPPEPLPDQLTTIQKARSVQVHQSWDQETEKQFLSQGHQTVKQPSLTLSGFCQHTDSISSHFNIDFFLNKCITSYFKQCHFI